MRVVRSVLSFSAALLALSTLSLAVQPDRIPGAIDSSQTVALAKSLHPKAQLQYDRGPVDPSFKLDYVTLLMSPSANQQKALDQLLAQQQDPKSPNYHKWLTPRQFADRFGLSQNDLDRVTNWLKSQGFQIVSIGGGRNSVIFSGTAAQVQRAFGAEIHNYKVDGEQHFANATPLMMPSALNGIVTQVMGLHSFLPHPAHQRRGSGAARNSRPDYFDGNYIFPNFLAPGDIATIYDINPLYTASTPIDGTGQKLAIVGQTDVYLTDINFFRSGFGLNQITGCTSSASHLVTACSSTYFHYVLVGTDPGAPSTCGDLGEADLDIEWSGAVARNAQIVYVNAPVTYDSNCNILSGGGVNAALNAAINPPSGPPLAQVVSMSYGICEAQAGSLETLFQQGNAEGVTIVNSSGDVGSATCDFSPPNAVPPFSPAVGGLAVSYPASSPEVTGVGGTAISLANDSFPSPSPFWSTTIGANGGTATSYIPEIPWNDDEGLAQYCHAPASGDTFCSTGGNTPGWVPLTSTATAAQVQEDIWLSIGGGGASNCFTQNPTTFVCQAGFPQPTWQQGLSVVGAPASVRYVPDVSLLASANFPGYVFCTAVNTTTSTCSKSIFDAVDTFGSIVGGTSASTPVFAGMVTLLNQYLVTNGLQGTPGVGNINPTLYLLAKTPSNMAFNQITSGDNNVFCQPGQPSIQPVALQCPAAVPPATEGVFGYSASNFDATTHYNLVTGLGSVDVNKLVLAWAATLPSFTLSANPNSTNVVAGHSVNSSITLTPVNGFNSAVTYTCSGTGVSCTFNPSTPTTVTPVTATILTTPNMATGPVTVTVKGTAGAMSKTTTVNLTVTATDQSFTLGPSNASITVAQGSPGSTNLTVTPVNGFSAALTYSCVMPSTLTEATCTTSAVDATTEKVSVTTTLATAQLRPPLSRSSRIWYAVLLPGLLGILFTAGSKRAPRALRLLSFIVVLGLSTLWLGACGGGSSNKPPPNPGTPKGNYTLTINATTGGASPVKGSTTVALTVN